MPTLRNADPDLEAGRSVGVGVPKVPAGIGRKWGDAADDRVLTPAVRPARIQSHVAAIVAAHSVPSRRDCAPSTSTLRIMIVAVYSTRPWDELSLAEANTSHELRFLEAKLDPTTTSLAAGADAVCVFVNDVVDRQVIEGLSALGVRYLALRSAGFNHVDLAAAAEQALTVVRVPAYSPNAVAEHTLALLLSLNRSIHRAHNRVREGNFSLDGLLGRDLIGKTVGIVGTGKIGQVVASIFQGFGMNVIAYDPFPTAVITEMGIPYVGLPELFARSDVITLHCPLTPETCHLIDRNAIDQMQRRPMLINTSRGALIETTAVIDGLKSGRIGSLALDVYEEEGDLFFEDLSNTVIQDDVFSRLLTFPNVLITGHQAFFTEEAVREIAEVTIHNLDRLEADEPTGTEVTVDLVG
jgi:D-lactate dehydrogenase